MEIRLFNFVKRENSTARPTGEGRKFDCKLKSETSIINPEIIIDFADQEDPSVHIYNYAYIPAFNRYYFINDIRVDGGMLWEYTLTVDVLGTYRDVISVSYLYLLRCSAQYDTNIVDSYYPIKTQFHEVNQRVYTPWFNNGDSVYLDDGCFILGIASKPGSSTASTYGSIKYIAVNKSNLATLVNYLMDANTLSDWQITLDGVTNEAAKAIIDPLQFIKSCQWTPIRYGDIDTTAHTGLYIWSWYAQSVSYKDMPAEPPYLHMTVTFSSIPNHPQSRTRGNYLNTEPFTKMMLNIPPFGIIDLDTTLTAGSSKITCDINYDLITGTGILEVHYGEATGTPACRIQSQIGVPIQLTQVYNDYISAAGGTVGGVLGTIGSIITGNAAGAVMGGIGAISSAAQAMKPVQSSTGGNGGFADLDGYACLYAVFYDIADEDRAHAGRPLCAEVNMSTMQTGAYCLALSGDIAINGTAEEQRRLKEYLEGGFYYG